MGEGFSTAEPSILRCLLKLDYLENEIVLEEQAANNVIVKVSNKSYVSCN
ncbi:hypothetical protein Scep_012474 [Stephania cephalantha]|uniref:Uncharacterized protein n=1 Tax=Stephania cephalantha TaxID=152367 RepID=A0AAP0JGK6_9MAGN